MIRARTGALACHDRAIAALRGDKDNRDELTGEAANVRTLIVDDDEDVRYLVRTTIEIANRGLLVAGEAVDGLDALQAWRDTDPDCIVIDQRMPGKTGIEVCEEILSEHPEQRIVLFTAFLDDTMRRTAADLGVRACLGKHEVHRLPEILWGLAAA
jgi:CheY-like chemotaxis protein